MTRAGTRTTARKHWVIGMAVTAIIGLGLAFAALPPLYHLPLESNPRPGPAPAEAPPNSQAGRTGHDGIAAEVRKRFDEAVVMLHAGKPEYAVAALHRVLELSPRMPEAHVNMGFALLDMKQFPAARDFFLSAIALNVRQVNAYYGLAEAHEGLGELPEAMGAMRTFLHLAPPDDSYRDKARAALWEWETQPRHAADRSQAGAQQPQAGRGEK